jgi:hypothetical protein
MAQPPILSKPTWARGLTRQIGFKKLFGKIKDRLAVRLMTEPIRKKTLSAVTPKGRAL